MRGKRPPLNSAEFNVREITKQLLLLEDHLSDDEKYCIDCIRKHLLTVEALAEEATMMDPDSYLIDECKDAAKKARDWIVKFSDGVSKYSLSQRIRRERKRLVEVSYDPRF